MKRNLLLAVATTLALGVSAQTSGSIDDAMLSRLRGSYQNTPTDRALRNALHRCHIDSLAFNSDNNRPVDMHFTYHVKSSGITNQKSSGRCWLFTGLNVLRSQMMAEHDLPSLTLSQNYNFFYDQLEKSNLFLQFIIDTAALPTDDRTVDFMFKHPINDGGQYTGVANIIMKYGVVPSEVMHETINGENTARLRQLLSYKLRENGLRLRGMAADNASAEALQQEKERMLSEIYRMLVLTLGEPPTEFEWTRRDKDGKAVDTRQYTPQSFYQEYAGNDLRGDYIMVMNDPMRPYYKLYSIDYDRHTYDGDNWTYINLPMEDIKQMAIASLKDGKMMYFSCDVAKQLDRARGHMDVDNFDYGALLGIEFGMDKRERISTYDSGSTHAMTLAGVDINDAGEPTRWLIENSWGRRANDGHLVATDRWMDEYLFRLAVNRCYAPKKVLDVLEQEPVLLPAWDPMFAPEE
ncbi:MAG: C1 family peptidase [Bacteroidales bacterium]|nr:C1 family peptidase [Bacteroidales bacterium]